MFYDECTAIVDAYSSAIMLADLAENDAAGKDICNQAAEIRDCLHDFIASLIYEALGDRGHGSSDDERR